MTYVKWIARATILAFTITLLWFIAVGDRLPFLMSLGVVIISLTAFFPYEDRRP